MSDFQPKNPYVYQPGAPTGKDKERIFAVSGPGAEAFENVRLTQKEAQELLTLLAREKHLFAVGNVDRKTAEDIVGMLGDSDYGGEIVDMIRRVEVRLYVHEKAKRP